METTYQENFSKQLQRLLHSVIKSQKRYIEASNELDSSELKNLFNKYATERNDIIAELTRDIKQLGAQSEDITDVKIEQKNWDISVPAIGTKKDQGILEKIRHAEQDTLDMYDEVLQGSILEDFNLKTSLMGQRLKINESFTEMDRQYFNLFKENK